MIALVLVTAPAAEAAGLASVLVEEGLIACANLSPVRSIYRWKGELCDAAETLLVMKTTAERLDALESRVGELHSYDVPEFVVVPTSGGNEDYLQWVRGETASPD